MLGAAPGPEILLQPSEGRRYISGAAHDVLVAICASLVLLLASNVPLRIVRVIQAGSQVWCNRSDRARHGRRIFLWQRIIV